MGALIDAADGIRDRLLAAYDSQLRTDAETPSAMAVELLGPLRLVTFLGGRGFITYRDLDGADAATVERLVREGLDYFSRDPGIERVEWKSRGHDHAPGLHEALLANGFVADETESIMIGDASPLAVDVPLPDGVTLRRITDEADVRAMSAMQDEVFGDPVSEDMAIAMGKTLIHSDSTEYSRPILERSGLLAVSTTTPYRWTRSV